jgi:hypothetical protein
MTHPVCWVSVRQFITLPSRSRSKARMSWSPCHFRFRRKVPEGWSSCTLTTYAVSVMHFTDFVLPITSSRTPPKFDPAPNWPFGKFGILPRPTEWRPRKNLELGSLNNRRPDRKRLFRMGIAMTSGAACICFCRGEILDMRGVTDGLISRVGLGNRNSVPV